MKAGSKFRWINLVYGILITIVGVLVTVFAFTNTGAIEKTVNLIIAIGLFVVGLTYVIASLVTQVRQFLTLNLFLGSIAIAIGVVLLIDTSLISTFMVLFLAALFLSLGVVSLTKGIMSIVFKNKASWTVMYMLIAIILLVFGVMIFVYYNTTKAIIYAFIGIAILAAGISELCVGIKKLK